MTRESRDSQNEIKRPRRSAFTLVELVIVVLIISIMSVVAIPKFGVTLNLHRANAAATRVKADLDLARSQAKMKSADQEVDFDASSNSYTLTGMADTNHSALTYSVDLSKYPYDAVLFEADFGGSDDVAFNGFGIPDSAGTVIVQVGSHTRTVTLDANGRSTVP